MGLKKFWIWYGFQIHQNGAKKFLQKSCQHESDCTISCTMNVYKSIKKTIRYNKLKKMFTTPNSSGAPKIPLCWRMLEANPEPLQCLHLFTFAARNSNLWARSHFIHLLNSHANLWMWVENSKPESVRKESWAKNRQQFLLYSAVLCRNLFFICLYRE
jgi:hypothetical protein